MNCKFRLIGKLESDLIGIGLSAGMELTGSFFPSNQSIQFDHHHVIDNSCVVWKDNYEIIPEFTKTTPDPGSNNLPGSVISELHQYRLTLKHDKGTVFMRMMSPSYGNAIAQAMLAESCPESAITNIKCLKY